MSCGTGGDLFAIVWDARTKKLYGLNASGRAPYAATIETYRAKGLAEIPTQGPLSWSVPSCVDGWETLRSRFGSKPLAELLAPAIRYAEEGFPVSEIIAADWKDRPQRIGRGVRRRTRRGAGGRRSDRGRRFGSSGRPLESLGNWGAIDGGFR